jgi:tetratricopeptide (TPR) repeat protein
MAGRNPKKPARRRNRRAEAAASPWWSMGPPAADEPLWPGDVGSLLAMFAEAIQEEQDERITIRRRGRPSKKHKALAEAEELVRVAEGLETGRAREIARKAVEISPDCARGHVLLAELSDDVHDAEREYRLGIAAGERALGKSVIERHMGQLGRVVEAQGLLLAHRGLAECLSNMGRQAEAIAECERIAALDADDHVVARFMHLDLLITQRQFAAARQLCDECRDEVFCHWPYARALVAFGEGGDTPEARRLLAEAIAANPHVPRLLLSGREVDPDGMITVGEEDEAEVYVRDFRRCWMDMPGALAWLRVAAQVPVEPGDREAGPVLERRQRWPSWPEEKRLLAQLPLDPTDEWEADLSENSEGVWCFQVASARDERPIAIDVLDDRPLPDDLWGTLTDAMRRPTLGDPRRPATLVVRPGVLPKTWRRKLEQIGIRQVVREELGTIERISRDVDARIAAAEADREADGADPAAATAAILAACVDLPRETGDVWEAVVRRSPAWVTGEGQPYLPWLAIVASGPGEALLGADMTRERPDAAAVVRLVGRAMQKTGVRPERVDVTTADLADAMREAFTAIDVPVKQSASLPAVDRLVMSLAESMTPPEAVAPLCGVPGITVEIGRAFYAAAAAFHRDRTWRRLPSDAAITVNVPGEGGAENRLVHAVVMGQSGMVQGIAVYEDDVALEVARSGDLEQAAGGTGLSVMFGEAFEIPAVDYDWIERNGFDVAGPEAWPMPARLNPGMNLRPPLVWELELLSGCLRDVAAFIAAVPPGTRSAGAWMSPSGWRLSWEPG